MPSPSCGSIIPWLPNEWLADSRLYTVNHTVLVLAFTPDNLAHVAYPSGIRPDQLGERPSLLVKGS